ncbi:MAG TPA: DUF4190 domain-containing protein [Nocardioidaceae bacterium]|nr:DUF4190 domain-containing protein [Nocardioidaceae bacterium]
MSYPPEPPPPGYGYGYGYGQPYGPVVAPTNRKATASLVTGIASLVLSWCCGLGLVGVVAVVLGVKARSEIRASGGTQQGEGLALSGIITGAVAAVLGLLILVVMIVAIAAGVDYQPEPGPGGAEL